MVDAEAEADKRRIEAEGEASAIFAKLEAEARGQYEILAKKGEGLQADHRRLRRRPAGVPDADARTLRQPGRGLGQGDLEHQVRQGRGLGKRRPERPQRNTANLLHNMARTLPPMMQVMNDIGGVEIPETLAELGGEDTTKPMATGKRRSQSVCVALRYS